MRSRGCSEVEGMLDELDALYLEIEQLTNDRRRSFVGLQRFLCLASSVSAMRKVVIRLIRVQIKAVDALEDQRERPRRQSFPVRTRGSFG